MAIDTRNERAACLGFLLSFRTVLPNPDAPADEQDDRQQVSFTWPGLLVGGAIVGQPTNKRGQGVPHMWGYGRLFQPRQLG